MSNKEYIRESSKKFKKSFKEKSLGNIQVIIKDELPDNLNIDRVLFRVGSTIPVRFLNNIDYILQAPVQQQQNAPQMFKPDNFRGHGSYNGNGGMNGTNGGMGGSRPQRPFQGQQIGGQQQTGMSGPPGMGGPPELNPNGEFKSSLDLAKTKLCPVIKQGVNFLQ